MEPAEHNQTTLPQRSSEVVNLTGLAEYKGLNVKIFGGRGPRQIKKEGEHVRAKGSVLLQFDSWLEVPSSRVSHCSHLELAKLALY